MPPARPTEVTIVVADDHELVRNGILLTLQQRRSWKVIGQASHGRQALDVCRESRPDILILDFHMPQGNGLDVLRELPSVSPTTRVLMLSMDASDTLIDEALLAGAQGFVLKSDAARELDRAVETIASGKPYFTSRVSERLLDALRGVRPRSSTPDAGPLTPRERQVVVLIASGKTNKEIAHQLGISVRTVETHRSNVMEKLDLHDVRALVLWAVKVGLCNPGGGAPVPESHDMRIPEMVHPWRQYRVSPALEAGRLA
jgi:DNA-binding NarL/FixJ family response regulator